MSVETFLYAITAMAAAFVVLSLLIFAADAIFDKFGGRR